MAEFGAISTHWIIRQFIHEPSPLFWMEEQRIANVKKTHYDSHPKAGIDATTFTWVIIKSDNGQISVTRPLIQDKARLHCEVTRTLHDLACWQYDGQRSFSRNSIGCVSFESRFLSRSTPSW